VSQGKVDEAVHEYEEAVRLLPGSAMAQTNFGYALMKVGRTGEAERHLREALRLEPANQQAHYALANLLQATGRIDEALAEFRAALERWTGPSSASVHNDYGVTLSGAAASTRPPRSFVRRCG
jgi:Tfp pilus assembly protein PilF